MIRGTTKLFAHLGYPTESFKAPMIYNPYFEKHGIDAVVVPRIIVRCPRRSWCASGSRARYGGITGKARLRRQPDLGVGRA